MGFFDLAMLILPPEAVVDLMKPCQAFFRCLQTVGLQQDPQTLLCPRVEIQQGIVDIHENHIVPHRNLRSEMERIVFNIITHFPPDLCYNCKNNIEKESP